MYNRVPFPLRDGGAIAVFALTKGYKLAGADIKLLTMNTTRHHVDMRQLPADFKAISDIETAEVDNRIRWMPALLNLFGSKPYHAERFISKQFENLLADNLKRQMFDIVQMEGLYTCHYIPVVRRHSRAKVVYRAHNIESVLWRRVSQNGSGWKKVYLGIQAGRLEKYERETIHQADAIVPISANDADWFRQADYSGPLHVAPFGIDLDSGKASVETDELSLFHLGAMDWLPNQEGVKWFLDEVWDAVHEKFPAVRFYVAGRDFPEWLKNRRQPGVVIVGEVDDSRQFIQSKGVMITPLKSGGGMRVKIIECMALGKPIVSTTVGAEGVEYSNGTDMLIADSPDEFVSAIGRLVSDKSYRETVGRNAFRLASEKYDNKMVVKRLLDFFSSIR